MSCSSGMTTEDRCQTLVGYFKTATPPAVWFSADVESTAKFSLLGALGIPNLTKQQLKYRLKTEGVTKSTLNGFNGIYVYSYRKELLVAHTSMPPTHSYLKQDESAISALISDLRQAPGRPTCPEHLFLSDATSDDTSRSSSGLSSSDVPQSLATVTTDTQVSPD